jgi:hypothetical protein
VVAIADRGHQAILRFYLDYPTLPSGIPAYLLADGLKTFPYTDSGNAASPTPSVSPDYRDARLIDCLVRFIHAFGARYDGDARIAYLTAGLYGFWGEWHVLDHPSAWTSLPAGQSASQDKDVLLRAYIESFHRTEVLVRVPGVTEDRALLAHFGFHDDSFLEDTLGPERWRFWPKMQTDRRYRPLAGASHGRRNLPAPPSRPFRSPGRTVKGEPAETAIATTHATWMLDSNLFTAVHTPAERANALRVERLLGYTLYCREWQLIRNKDGSATITVRVENRGVAPMYYAWPVEVEALDATGRIAGRGSASWPLPALLPGKTAEWSISLNSLPDASRTALLRIANPMPGGHPVAFANGEMSTVVSGWLTLTLNPEN